MQVRRRFVLRLVAGAATLVSTFPAMRTGLAQVWPTRPLTMVVPYAAGGPVDTIGRVTAAGLSQVLGQQVVIENMGGAGGMTGASRAAKAAPDGYTLVLGNIGTHAASVGLYKNLAYDPRTSFEPVMLVATTPMVLTVKKDLAVKTLNDVVALAKQRKITMGSAGTGSSSHLTLLLFQHVTHTEVQHVPYRGLSQAENDLLAGQIETLFDQVLSASPQINAGGVKPIVVAASERAKAIPDVPSATEAGMPDLITITWTALFAPKGTPKAIVAKLNAAVDAAMRDEKVAKRLTELGADLPPPGEQRSSAYLGKLVASEVAKWTPLIRAAGVAN
jgi:tripartite-type tricarboxylate transporter receptor subunit TctC